MNWRKIIGVLVATLMVMSFSYAQSSLSEEEYMEFHEFFFTGLKEKGIGNYKKALHSFENAHEIDSLNRSTWFELSKVQALLLAYDDAEYFSILFLEQEPTNKFVLDHLANLYSKQYRYGDAIKIREKILEISPKQVDQLILLYMKNKQKADALRLIEVAEKNGYATLRTVTLKKYLLKSSLSKKKIVKKKNVSAKNIHSLKEIVAKEGTYTSYLNLLRHEEKMQLYTQLLEDASRGLELYPSQAQLYLSKGIALNKLEKFNLAVETCMIGLDFVIENRQMESKFYHQLAVSYGKLNQSSQAKKFAEKSLKLSKKE